MITGVHAIMYAKDADATRKFLREVLELPNVDGGRGWLIFALPPAEIAAHPVENEGDEEHELFLMCDNLKTTMAELSKKGIEFVGGVNEQRWGLLATLRVPGGGTMCLYEPRHPTAIGLKK
jgi:hypothetical protein